MNIASPWPSASAKAAFALQDALIAAAIDQAHRKEHLRQADIALTGLRKTLLLCLDLELLQARPVSPRQRR